MRAPLVYDFIHEISFQAQRSRGPGGQNVNKTNSSVQLRWPFSESLILSDEQKALIRKKLESIINTDGILHIRSDTHREFDNNKRDVLEKLQKALDKAFFKPKARKATKPTYSSQVKRQDSKKKRGDVKKSRQTKWY